MAVGNGLVGLLASAALSATVLCFVPAAQAATYDFTGQAVGGATIVSLDITTDGSDGSSPSDGGVFITSVTGTVLGNSVELAGDVGVLTPANFGTSTDGLWTYDNVLYPNLGTVFDNPGLLLAYTSGPGTGFFINIFSPGSTAPDPYALGQSPSQTQQDLISGSLVATPLPSTWTMLLAGFAAFGFFAFRGSKKSSAMAIA